MVEKFQHLTTIYNQVGKLKRKIDDAVFTCSLFTKENSEALNLNSYRLELTNFTTPPLSSPECIFLLDLLTFLQVHLLYLKKKELKRTSRANINQQ